MTFLSVIVPTYNSDKTLSKTLISLLNQRFKNFEILIIDGKSTDNTLEIARSFTDPRIKIFSENDSGIYDAMNKGIKLAKGKWIYFLGSDDIMHDETVFEDVHSLCKNESYDVVYGNVIFKVAQKMYDGPFSDFKLLQKNICHQAIFHNRKLFQKKGLFNLKYKMLADYEFNIKWFNDKSIKRTYIDRLVAVYNEDGSCFNVPDVEFIKDWKHLIRSNFPFLTLWFHNHKKHVLTRLISKYLLSFE